MAKAIKTLMIPDELVMNKIYMIRGQKVMLDKDLAELYGVTTGNLNLAVKEIRNVSLQILYFSSQKKSSKI